MSIKITLTICVLITALFTSAQSTVSGVISDEKGIPVSSASVIIKGSKNGTQADENGRFSIAAATGNVLVISALNFATQEITVGNEAQLTVHLKAADQSLNEVVVTALGIRRERRELGTATQTVSSDQLNKSGTGNLLGEMQGKASGLTVINSTGDPGGGTYIRLRGVTSITGNNQPLLVVDGVPIDNSVNSYDPTNAGFQASGASGNLTGGAQPTNRGNDLNPDDIESINVLKGPAATALYGIQAASGAIVITTKKGSGKRGTQHPVKLIRNH